MTITVSQPEKVYVVEGQKVEFKTSAFYAPGEQNPGFKQMRTIAETVGVYAIWIHTTADSITTMVVCTRMETMLSFLSNPP